MAIESAVFLNPINDDTIKLFVNLFLISNL